MRWGLPNRDPGGFETALPHQLQARGSHEPLGGRVQGLGREAHRFPQGMAEQVERVLDPTGTEQRGGVQGGAQLPGTESPSLLRQGDRPIQQCLVQVVRDEPQAEVEQCPATERWMLGVETVQHHLPALVHHREFHCLLITDVAVGL